MTSFAGFADILNRVGSKTCKRSHRKRQKRPNRELRKKSKKKPEMTHCINIVLKAATFLS